MEVFLLSSIIANMYMVGFDSWPSMCTIPPSHIFHIKVDISCTHNSDGTVINRKCTLCNDNDIQDEYHVVLNLKCAYYSEVRGKYILTFEYIYW